MTPHSDPVAYWLIVGWFALILAAGLAGMAHEMHRRNQARARNRGRRLRTHPAASNVTRLPRVRHFDFEIDA